MKTHTDPCYARGGPMRAAHPDYHTPEHFGRLVFVRRS